MQKLQNINVKRKMLKNASKLITPLQRKSRTTTLLMHSSQCMMGFSRKNQTQCLWNGVEISLGFFTPSNGKCITKICAWCVHGLMIQKMKKLMIFWMSIYRNRKRWSMLLNSLYQTQSQHWLPFYSWKMAPPHVCVGRWKTSMNGTKNINTTSQTKQKRWNWPTGWFLLFSFLLGFIISITRSVV